MGWSSAGQIDAIGSLGGAAQERAAASRASRIASGGPVRTFSSALARVEDPVAAQRPTPDRSAKEQALRDARAAAEELVAVTLVQPVLAQMRETNQAEGPFAPGHWEKTFAPLVDAEIARRIVGASGWGLVEEMAQDFASRDARARAPVRTTAGADPWKEPGDG